MAERVCAVYGGILVAKQTRYGTVFECRAEGCTVMCWDGETSTPADERTRDARKSAHAAFDPLWRRKIKFASRNKAYKWLAAVMGVPAGRAHIGMFDLEQCRRLISIIKSGEAPSEAG